MAPCKLHDKFSINQPVQRIEKSEPWGEVGTIKMMVDFASKIKISKSGLIRPENILNGAPQLMCHFHLLFDSMIQHSYVPTEFLR